TTLNGERRELTVLLADFTVAMDRLADLPPEEARRFQDAILERMMEAVHRYDGVIVNIMIYGIMALFGAPIAYEDHAVRACSAALAMKEALDRYGDEVRHSLGVAVDIRGGLNSGEVIITVLSPDLHMDYTAVGDTVTIARHLLDAAKSGAILIGASTLR